MRPPQLLPRFRSFPSRTPSPVLLLGAVLLPLLSVSSAPAQEYDLQQTYVGENLLDQFGIATAGIGDVDGDGHGDFLVGANVNDDAITSGGKAYLYRGGSDYPSVASETFVGSLERGYFGQALSGGGDFDGDGLADWAVGAPGGGTTGEDPGRVYLYLGGESPATTPALILEGRAPLSNFGKAVSLEGDLDGDGYADLCVGAPRDGGGRVYVYRGAATPDSTADHVLSARVDDLRFGDALALLPDDDGDGCDDLLVGVPKASPSVAWSGAVLLYRGSASFDTDPDLELVGEAAGDEFGTCIWSGPDLSGDGRPDVLVGAPFANPAGATDAGRGYLFHAGSALDSLPDLTFSGSEAGGRFGLSVTAGFDWNGDGGLDLAFGAPDHDEGGIDAGRVSVFFGGSVVDAEADTSWTGSAGDHHLGTSLSSAGDLLSQGGAALLIGGYNGSNEGRVLVFGRDRVTTAGPSLPPVLKPSFLAPYPNPFNPRVVVRLHSPRSARWRVEVLDRRGRRVATLLDRSLRAGTHDLSWRGKDERGRSVASGVYEFLGRSELGEISTSVTLVR